MIIFSREKFIKIVIKHFKSIYTDGLWIHFQSFRNTFNNAAINVSTFIENE